MDTDRAALVDECCSHEQSTSRVPRPSATQFLRSRNGAARDGREEMDEALARLEITRTQHELVSLPDELVYRILLNLDGVSLAHWECTCTTLRRQTDDEAWRLASLKRWGWLFRSIDARQTWRHTYAELHTHNNVRFCVIGGEKRVRLPMLDFRGGASAGLAHSYSPRTGRWSAFSRPQVAAREMPAVVRSNDGKLVVMGGTSLDRTTGLFRTLDSVECCESPWSEWRPMPGMATARCCCSAAADEAGAIYCVGGGESMYRSE